MHKRSVTFKRQQKVQKALVDGVSVRSSQSMDSFATLLAVFSSSSSLLPH